MSFRARKAFEMDRTSLKFMCSMVLGLAGGMAHAQNATEALDELTPDQLMQEYRDDMKARGLKATETFDLIEETTRNTDNGLPQVQVEVFKKYKPRGYRAKYPGTLHGTEGEYMVVRVDGRIEHVFLVSTGASGNTPVGTYKPFRMHKFYYSRTFNNALMDWAVFFKGGIALHSTTGEHFYELGMPASKGCVRIARPNARTLFKLFQQAGCDYNDAWSIPSSKCTNIRITVRKPGTAIDPNLEDYLNERIEDDFDYVQSLLKSVRYTKNGKTGYNVRLLDRCSESDKRFEDYARNDCPKL